MYLCGTAIANRKLKGQTSILVDCANIMAVFLTSLEVAEAFPVGRMLSIQIEQMPGAPVASKAPKKGHRGIPRRGGGVLESPA
jgi:hypothetical protein